MCTFYDKQGDDINQWMVASGFAYEYFGKTKKTFREVSEKKTIVSECDNDYFETPRKESGKTDAADADADADDFEEIEKMS
jgi:endonuclease YncB( thermonuclease family)